MSARPAFKPCVPISRDTPYQEAFGVRHDAAAGYAGGVPKTCRVADCEITLSEGVLPLFERLSTNGARSGVLARRESCNGKRNEEPPRRPCAI
jgi:hypothetical protein